MGAMRSNDSQKIIVVGIPKTMDDAALTDLFSAFGAVADAKVVRHATTNESRGFGFVTFTAAAAMRKAVLEMDKKKVDGRVLNVRQLVPKDKFFANKEQEKASGDGKQQQQRPCWLLRKGKCLKGAHCPFSHELQDGEFGSCFEFVQNGSCKRGDKCKFLHPVKQDDDADAEGNDGEQTGDKKAKKKDSKAPVATAKASGQNDATTQQQQQQHPQKRVCFSFQNGRCHRGKKCLFLHEKLDVPKVDVAAAKQSAKAAQDVVMTGGFEVVKHEDTSRKRQRDGGWAAPDAAEDDSSSDEEVAIEVKEAPRAKQTKKQTAPQPTIKTTKPAKKEAPTEKKTKAAPAPAEATEAPPSPPLRALADHVLRFMGQQQQQQQNAQQQEAAAKPTVTKSETQPEPQRQQTSKKRPVEKVDMGAAFDDCDSEDDEKPAKKRRVMDKAQLRANREKLKAERRGKRNAKKEALWKLQSNQEVDLSNPATAT
ncbi:TPA: hypothetical protein N0F65_002162 [Lagenidium giganteum]|uniref:Uncharacterized protein n=1 Tax=Lagenidium giganteum TaxID=4803 RepID=A0AAV2YPW4_9STRA|nr:TPA: hypothetical protein N0F65_002162 [Lagenidium giganteum]